MKNSPIAEQIAPADEKVACLNSLQQAGAVGIRTAGGVERVLASEVESYAGLSLARNPRTGIVVAVICFNTIYSRFAALQND